MIMKQKMLLLFLVLIITAIAVSAYSNIYEEDGKYEKITLHDEIPGMSLVYILGAVTAIIFIYVAIACGLRSKERRTHALKIGKPPKKKIVSKNVVIKKSAKLIPKHRTKKKKAKKKKKVYKKKKAKKNPKKRRK